jgi:hypothetical protein
MEETLYTVEAHYPWEGNFGLDTVIELAAGEGRGASGCGFGYRDMAWYCDTHEAAVKVYDALVPLIRSKHLARLQLLDPKYKQLRCRGEL